MFGIINEVQLFSYFGIKLCNIKDIKLTKKSILLSPDIWKISIHNIMSNFFIPILLS